MVEGQLRRLEWKSSDYRGPRPSDEDRCFLKRLGSILHGSLHRGSMVKLGEEAPYQLCFRCMGTNDLLPLKVLSYKLGLLLSPTSMEKVSKIVVHDLRYKQFTPDGVGFDFPELTS